MSNLKNLGSEIISIVILSCLYVTTRLAGVLTVPIFTDEAIYIRWSQIMATDASLRYLPLVDGKPPLFMWLMMIPIRLFEQVDPLFLGRLVSVGCGLFGLLGVFFLSHYLFKSSRLSFIAGILYVFAPFTFFYDRIALADSLLAALATWTILLSFLLARKLSLSVSLILGWAIGLGMLTKSPAIFFILMQPLLIIEFIQKNRISVKNLFRWSALVAISLVEAMAIFSVLRLFPLFNMLNDKNASFVITFTEFLNQPFGLLVNNLRSMIVWEIHYLTIPLTIMIVYAIVYSFAKKSKEVLILLLIFLLEFAAMASFNKVLFVRYLLTFTPTLLVICAFGTSCLLSQLRNNLFKLLVLCTLFIIPLYTVSKLISDPMNAPIPRADSEQYLHAWPAGWGVTQVREFLAKESKKIVSGAIITEGTFGLMPYSLEIYQKEYPNIRILPIWPLPETIPDEFIKLKVKVPLYLLVYQRQTVPAGWNLTELLSFKQGNGTDRLRLYLVN